MTEHQLEEIHRYTKYRVVEALIKKRSEGNKLSSLKDFLKLQNHKLNIVISDEGGWKDRIRSISFE